MAPTNRDLKDLVASTLSSFERFRLKRRNLRFPDESSIGGGGFGRVHRADLATRMLGGPTTAVVVKKLIPRGKSFLPTAVALAREVAVWAPLNHPNLLPFVGFYLDIKGEEAWLVSPYVENGTIFDYIKNQEPDSRERVEMVTDTIQGLHYLHTRQPPVCHGDIKPDNILINSLGRAILCDFGLALTVGDSTGLTTTGFQNAATPLYQSPEIFIGKPRSLKGDIWAWGCLALQLLSGVAPYEYTTGTGFFDHLYQGNPPARLEEIDLLPSIRELFASCWAVDPELRPTSAVCLDVLTAPDKDAFRQKSLWASPEVVDMLRRDLNDVLGLLDRIRLRRSLIKLSPEDATKWGGVRPAKMGQGIVSFGNNVAVKTLKVSGVKASCIRMLIAVIRELRVWSTLDHPNILPLVGFYLSDSLEEAWFISTLMPQGNVAMYLDQKNPNSKRRLGLIRDVASGLAYLHGLEPPVCHGDVKPSNILVNDSGGALLCDFGLSRSMEGLQTGLTTSTFDQCRSTAYHSPELLLGGSRRSPASDLWAFGCVAHEILSGRSPYFEITKQAEIIECVRRSDFPNDVHHESIPTPVQHVIIGCWRANPELRSTAKFCFSELDWIVSLNINRSQITSLESGADAEWTTGSATYDDEHVMVRRVRIPNEKQHTLPDVLHRLRRWQGMRPWRVQRLYGICLAEFPNYFWLILQRSLSKDVVHYAADKSIQDQLELVYNLTDGLDDLQRANPPFCHGRLNPRYILLNSWHRAMVSHPDLFGSWCTDAETREDVAYSSPEAIDGGELTVAGDVWSWACIAVEVLSGRPPYSGVTDPAMVKSLIREGVPPAEIDDLEISDKLKGVIQACWAREPGARPSMRTCYNTMLSQRTPVGLIQRQNAMMIATITQIRDIGGSRSAMLSASGASTKPSE